MHRWGILVLASILLMPSLGFAARTVSADHSITVRLELSQITAIAFPEHVGRIITGLDERQASFDKDGSYVFLGAKDPSITGHLFVVGESGKLYKVVFSVASPADDQVNVVIADDKATRKAEPFTLASFLRALRAGTSAPGLQQADVPTPAIPDPRLSLVSSSAVVLGATIGVVLGLRNTSQQPLTLDIRLGHQDPSPPQTATINSWVWPPKMTLRALATEEEFLGPDGQTRLYVVLERRP